MACLPGSLTPYSPGWYSFRDGYSDPGKAYAKDGDFERPGQGGTRATASNYAGPESYFDSTPAS